MRRPALFIAALGVLSSVWIWPLPALSLPPFAAHMLMHMAVVAGAAPLLALAVAGGSFDPVRRAPRLFGAIPASMLELVAVWAFHAPALHHYARHHALGSVLEQATFLGTGLLLWVAALGGSAQQRRARAPSGIVGLLLTSMHMTLLGVLLALGPRPLYGHTGMHGEMSALADQQLGGVIMLLWGMSVYLAGGVALAFDILRRGRVTV